jgi:hypothetical protein
VTTLEWADGYVVSGISLSLIFGIGLPLWVAIFAESFALWARLQGNGGNSIEDRLDFYLVAVPFIWVVIIPWVWAGLCRSYCSTTRRVLRDVGLLLPFVYVASVLYFEGEVGLWFAIGVALAAELLVGLCAGYFYFKEIVGDPKGPCVICGGMEFSQIIRIRHDCVPAEILLYPVRHFLGEHFRAFVPTFRCKSCAGSDTPNGKTDQA